MKHRLDTRVELGRVTVGPFASIADLGPNGAFFVQGPCGAELKIIASDGTAGTAEQRWEHVSVSTVRRCPNWIEMCFVKDLFWDGGECVLQFHPPKSEYVNNHPYCLHLWRPLDQMIPTPPSEMVGVLGLSKKEDVLAAARKYVEGMK